MVSAIRCQRKIYINRLSAARRPKGGRSEILTAVHLRLGEYWRSLETRSTASGGIRLWKICKATKYFSDIFDTKSKASIIEVIRIEIRTHLMPGVSLDLWEFKLGIVRIHTFDFLTSWCPKYLVENNNHLAGSRKTVIGGWFQSSDNIKLLSLARRLRKFYFDYLNKLINSTFTRKERLPRFKWPKGKEKKPSVQSCSLIVIHPSKKLNSLREYLSEKQFSKDTTHRPHVNGSRVLSSTKYEFWCSIITGTNVWYIWLTFNLL